MLYRVVQKIVIGGTTEATADVLVSTFAGDVPVRLYDSGGSIISNVGVTTTDVNGLVDFYVKGVIPLTLDISRSGTPLGTIITDSSPLTNGNIVPIDPATTTTLGGVKAGSGLAVAVDGTLSTLNPTTPTTNLTDFANSAGTTTGLVYGYQAGVIRQDNVTTAVVAGTVALTASILNYVEVTGAGVVSANTTGFTAGRFPMATVLTGVSTITTITDKRGVIAIASADVDPPFTGGTLTSALNMAPTVVLASAATVAIGAAIANSISITGVVSITAFDVLAAGATRTVVFAGALVLTHNAVSLILPGAANITTAANDSATFLSLGGGNWQCTSYQKASGTAIVQPAPGVALNAINVFTKSQSTAMVALTDAASVAFDASASNTYELLATSAVGATRAIADATLATAGMVKRLFYYQDSAGSRALTWGATYQGVAGGAVPAASTAANAIDLYVMTYSATKTKWIVEQIKGS